jgi:hypothetical protein
MPYSLTVGRMLLLACLAAAPSSVASEKPRLVLQITVDQFRGDLPTRYFDRLGEGGLRYLLVDVAITLATAIGTLPPSGAAGEVLQEVLGQ